MDELERDFLNEVCHMRMEIAYKRLLQTRTHKEAKRVKERDVAIEELYQQVEKECTDEGKKLLFKYTDEMVYRESEDADFYYKSGFFDGVQLIVMLQKLATKLQKENAHPRVVDSRVGIGLFSWKSHLQ